MNWHDTMVVLVSFCASFPTMKWTSFFTHGVRGFRQILSPLIKPALKRNHDSLKYSVKYWLIGLNTDPGYKPIYVLSIGKDCLKSNAL